MSLAAIGGDEMAVPVLKWWLVTFHETDGNDCTVFETVVEAASPDAAESLVGEALDAQLERDGRAFEPDGNALGCYYNCEESCPEECEGHGGIASRGVEGPFDSEKTAREAHSKFHLWWEIPLCEMCESAVLKSGDRDVCAGCYAAERFDPGEVAL